MSRQKPIAFHLALIGALALLAMLSSFYYGLMNSNDLNHHLQLARIINDSIHAHELYPSLAGEANQGYSDVTIRFYPPFSYYLLATAESLVGNWYDACRLTFFLLFWLSGIGVYFWARENVSAECALLAAGLYIFAPYHLNQIYNDFFYPEFTAAALLPFCFLFLTRISRRGNLPDVLGLAISYALLILTHLPLTVIGSLTLAVYGLMLFKRSTIFRFLLKSAAAVFLALVASSFYWLRMLTELNWVNLSDKSFYAGVFDYRNNFLLNPQNIYNFSTDSACLWLAELMLIAVFLLAVPSFFFLIRKRKPAPGFPLPVVTVFFVSVFMASQFSQFIWDRLSFLQNIQFPWRWMTIISLSGAVFAAAGILRTVDFLNQSKRTFALIPFGLVLAIFFFTSAFIIKNAVYLSRADFNNQIAQIEERDFHEFWWTRWAKAEALGIRDKLTVENRSTEIAVWGSTEKEFTVSAGPQAFLRVSTFYYPHWQALVNGENIQIQKDANGAMIIALPETAADVKLKFCEPAFVRAANFISAFAWMIFLICFGGWLAQRIYNLTYSNQALQTL